MNGGCGPETMTVVSGDIWSEQYGVDNIFSHNKAEQDQTGYWLGPELSTATFVINLGCQLSFVGIQLVNVHNAHHKDRASKTFR